MAPTTYAILAALALLATIAGCDGTANITGNTVAVPVAGASGAPIAGQPAASPSPSSTIAPIEKLVKDITIQPEHMVVEAGTAYDVIAVVSYVDGSFDSNVTWSSSDATIVSVNPTTGRMTALKQGVASIVAQSPLDKTKKTTATVSVRPAEVNPVLTRVTPSSAKIRVGQTVQLSAEIQLSDGRTSPNVKWTSSNTRVATVSRGLVTGAVPGVTTIQATALDEPTKTASATIEVVE